MELKLTALPEEILDHIISYLLPHYRLMIKNNIASPELLACRLVCWALHYSTTRWICRRQHLRLCNNATSHIPSQFITPNYAVYTQVLRISLTNPKDCSADGSMTLQLLPTIASNMSSLRILLLRTSGHSTLPCSILSSFISAPLLDTISLDIVDTQTVDWSQLTATNGETWPLVKRLDLKRVPNFGPLVKLFPQVEALSLRPSSSIHDVLSDATLPWKTLRQLTLEHVLDLDKTCSFIQDNFEKFKQKHPDIDTSLNELMVAHNLTVMDVYRLLETFDGHRLRTLLLGCIVNLDIILLACICAVFPDLVELSLFCPATEWSLSNSELERYASTLSPLKELHTLYLNCVSYHNRENHDQLERIIYPFISHCPKISCVRFVHQSDGYSTFVRVGRDAEGGYDSGRNIYENGKDDCWMTTSAWRREEYISDQGYWNTRVSL